MATPDQLELIKSVRKKILLASLVLYGISLVMPCFCTTKECGTLGHGAQLVIFGILGFLGGESAAWCCSLANPLLLFSWIYFNKNSKVSLTTSFFAVCLCLMFLGMDRIMTDESGSNFAKITKVEIGYWLWLSSACIILLGNVFLFKKYQITPPPPWSLRGQNNNALTQQSN